MEQLEVQRITSFLRDESGLCFAGRRERSLLSHLEARVARLGLTGLREYLDLLRGSAAEQRELYDLITVNETSFFRNEQQFRDLARVIIPRLEQRPPSRRRRLRILSAGCSTGEEPYSLAMTLLETIRYPLAWEIEIVAGDLSAECLRFAAAARYPEGRLKGIPPGYRDRYFRQEGGEWVLRDEVRGLVSFVQLNLARVLAGEGIPGVAESVAAFDLIFCRNVLIYFPLETQQLVIEALQRLLVPGGYLCTGDAEPLHLYRHELAGVAEATSLIYRKEERGTPPPGAAEVPAPPPPVHNYGVRELLLCVADSSLWLRDDAIERLLQLGLDKIGPDLEEAVGNDGEADLRNGAMEVLVRFGEKAVPLLVALLQDPGEEVRNFATVMLGRIGSRRALAPLVAALADPDLNVRHGAAEALGKIGDERAVEPLLELLDQGFWLQFPAIAALGQIGSPQGAPRLLELLDDDLLFVPVAQALQQIGDPRALPHLRLVAQGGDAMKRGLASQIVTAIEEKNSSLPGPYAAGKHLVSR